MQSASVEPLGVRADVADFSDVRRSDQWQAWSRLTERAAPFLAPEFFALTRPLAPPGDALVAEALRDEELLGALPLVLSGRTLFALRGEQTPSFDFCGTPEGLDAIWRRLRRDRRWDVLVIKNVPADSLLATRLVQSARRDGCPSVVLPGADHAYFDLDGFESRLSPKFLKNLERCARKAGGVELESIASPTRSEFRQALAIEAMAWKGRAGSGMTSDRDVAHLYAGLLRTFGKRGRARLSFLRAGGQRIALLVSVEDEHTLYALKIGYDPARANVSPGHLVVWKVAADAARRGLRQLDFCGRPDDWKRKWTDLSHPGVSVVVYRRSLGGLASYVLREKVKPALPAAARDPRTLLWRGCQRDDHIGVHSLRERIAGRLDHGLGIRSGLVRIVSGEPRHKPGLGAPSAHAPGSWVRVLDGATIRATLDERERCRGLAFVPSQWPTAGKVYRVMQQVRRIRDDRGRLRPVGRTVLLEGVTCAGSGSEPAGCGRHCPLMYRDEWLEAAEAPRRPPPAGATSPHARIKSAEEIRAGLDAFGRRDGLRFMPEMARHTEKRFRIAGSITRVFEYDAWGDTRRPVYILEGLYCSGTAAGGAGPCHRACSLLWHEDWLDFDAEPEKPT